MKYLLDTCVVSDIVKGHERTLARVKSTAPSLIAVSTVTRMEVDYGLALNAVRARKIAAALDAFFASITTLPFDEIDAKAAAQIRAALKPKGQPIGAYDALIAGTAVARGLVVVTSNTDEFERVGALQVEDWRTDQNDD